MNIRCRWRHLLHDGSTSMLLSFVFTILLLAPVTVALNEGESCIIKSTVGICMAMTNCEMHLTLNNLGPLDHNALVNCGYSQHEEIVCCPSIRNIYTTTPSIPKVKDTDSQSITTATKTKRSSMPEVRGSDRAAIQACNRLEEILQVRLPPHILDGPLVSEHEYPHMVAIAFNRFDDRPKNYEFLCAGTLIEDRFVLTAAHCVNNREIQPIFVRLGVIDLTDNRGVNINISRIHIHDNYTSSSKYNDIAIIELATPASYSDSIYPACLYTDLNDPSSNFEYYAAGWGTIHIRTRSHSNLLLRAKLNIVPLDRCNSDYEAAGLKRYIADGILESQICAVDLGSYKDACQGDSGGPLQVLKNSSIKSYSIVGVLSTAFECSSTRRPVIYTRVSAYLDYIESIVWPKAK